MGVAIWSHRRALLHGLRCWDHHVQHHHFASRRITVATVVPNGRVAAWPAVSCPYPRPHIAMKHGENTTVECPIEPGESIKGDQGCQVGGDHDGWAGNASHFYLEGTWRYTRWLNHRWTKRPKPCFGWWECGFSLPGAVLRLWEVTGCHWYTWNSSL